MLAIFLLAFFLRTYKLQDMPRFLHQDEIMNGYVGRYILENGRDLYDNKWPILYFDNFGDFPNVVPMYISGLSTYLFGINAFAIRFPIALLGSLAVFPMYYISKYVFRNQTISLLSAFVLAILPWHIVLSRATAENIMAPTFFLTGICFLSMGIQQKKPIWLLLTGIIYLFTYLLYPGQRIIVPLSLLPTFFLTNDPKIRRALLGLCLFFFAVTLAISSTPWGRARFQQTSIFYFNNQVNNKANHYALTAPSQFYLTTRIFNNKLVGYAREAIHQYLSYFSFNVLFTSGGHPDRYLVPDQGLLYITFLVMMVATLVISPATLPKINRPLLFYLLFLISLSALPAALTLDEVPNVHRAAMLSVTSLFLIGFVSLRLLKTKILSIPALWFFIPLILLEFSYFQHQYYAQGPAAQEFARYDVRTILTKRIIELRPSYKAIILPREIFPIYYLFYNHNFDPALAGKFSKNLFINQIDNIHFIDTDCPSESKDLPIENTLIVDMAQCLMMPGYKTVEITHHANGTDAYKLMERVLWPVD